LARSDGVVGDGLRFPSPGEFHSTTAPATILRMRRIIAVAAVIGMGFSTAIWAAVSTDHWPFDDRRQPATAVYEVNGAIGKWLTEHGEVTPNMCSLPPAASGTAPKRGFTPDELAEVQRALHTDPRYRDRVFMSGLPAACGAGRG
jgi:hypothetical protein